jgi:hypothetical protein
LVLTASATQATVIIDDFEVGDFSLLDIFADGSSDSVFQSSLDTAHVVGGVREVHANLTDPGLGASASAVLTTTPLTDDAVVLSVTAGAGFFLFNYGQSNLDLSGEDRFIVDVPQCVPAALMMDMHVHTDNLEHGYFYGGTPVPGGVVFPFSGFRNLMNEEPISDWSCVNLIQLSLDTILVGQQTATISDLRATPEPATLSLLALGGLALLRKRTK